MPVLAVTSGYVQRIDHKRLLRAAGQREAVVCLTFRRRLFVLEGEALAHVLPAERGTELRAAIHGAVMVGQHGTLEQDIGLDRSQHGSSLVLDGRCGNDPVAPAGCH